MSDPKQPRPARPTIQGLPVEKLPPGRTVDDDDDDLLIPGSNAPSQAFVDSSFQEPEEDSLVIDLDPAFEEQPSSQFEREVQRAFEEAFGADSGVHEFEQESEHSYDPQNPRATLPDGSGAHGGLSPELVERASRAASNDRTPALPADKTEFEYETPSYAETEPRPPPRYPTLPGCPHCQSSSLFYWRAHRRISIALCSSCDYVYKVQDMYDGNLQLWRSNITALGHVFKLA